MAKCPNDCGTDLEKLPDGTLYCQVCDLTYKAEKGRITVENKKGVIQDLQEKQAMTEQELAKIKEALFGDKEVDFFGF